MIRDTRTNSHSRATSVFPFFKSERTCAWLAASIDQARSRLNIDLWAYVFMPDHIHLIVRPRESEYDISEFRKLVKVPVARQAIAYLERHAPEWIPRITRTRGSKSERLFWQSGGGYDRNIVDARALAKMLDYVHNNPVRAGLVEQAQHWKWSIAKWFLGLECQLLTPDRIHPDWLIESD